jgi:hypothetical protein
MLSANRHFKCLTNPKFGAFTNPIEGGQDTNRCVVLAGDIAQRLTALDTVGDNLSRSL